MAEKLNFMVFRTLFFIHISNKDDIWQGGSLSEVLLGERNLNILK